MVRIIYLALVLCVEPLTRHLRNRENDPGYMRVDNFRNY